ncbi:MAG: DegT/DnrJ/EryC1/StrS family aminotransferase [Desulfobacteraceae bacterium]|nr:MAG: DegT/DnrJ/EryC1/StrS family aminotransferase [Desulfobacteraceae bacterium]
MIPQNNPLANYIGLSAEIDQAVKRVLESGWYILGDEISSFEREFAGFLGAKFVVGVANGTEAICLALKACGIKAGDKVITVSHTAVATVAAIEMIGAVPVLAEIDPGTYTMDPSSLRPLITEDTRAIVPVHLYGHPADLGPILKMAEENGLFVIEDCAQSNGAAIHDRKTGTWGHAAAFSFYPTKNLGCLGDGGAVATGDPQIYQRLIAARQYGWDRERISRTEGLNSRLDEIQAAILRIKLRRLDENNRKRAQIAERYSESLRTLPISLPTTVSGRSHVYHQYVIRFSGRSLRDRLIESLKADSIQSAVHYPVPVHLQPFFSDRFGAVALRITEEVCETILSLPMFPELTPSEIDRVCARIHQFFKEAQ